MSTASIPAPYPYSLPDPREPFLGLSSLSGPTPTRPILRRLDQQNGQALEQVGHAIEYLIDSRRHASSSLPGDGIEEAIEILSKASRAIFAQCPEIVPVRQRIALRLHRWLSATPAGRG